MTIEPSASGTQDVIPFRDAIRTWFAISLQTFGGPAGQIAIMQRTLVDEKRWIGQGRFLHALGYCTLLPGPEAQQLAIYIGWLLNGVRGGLVAGILFVLPGMLALLVLSAVYVGAGDSTLVTALFAGLAPAVLAIVAQAVVRVAGRALGHPAWIALAVAAFLALSVFGLPFPVVIAGAAAVGWALGRWAPSTRNASRAHGNGRRRAVAADPRRCAAHRTAEPRALRESPHGGSARLGRPPRCRGGAHRDRQRVHPAGTVLLRRRAGHLRRRLRGPRLRRAEGCRGVRLARPRRDGPAVSLSPRPRPDR